jgi:hypothetical protein
MKILERDERAIEIGSFWGWFIPLVVRAQIFVGSLFPRSFVPEANHTVAYN